MTSNRLAIFIGAFSLILGASAHAVVFTITDVAQGIGLSADVEGLDLNESGQIAGTHDGNAVRWDTFGGVTETVLGTGRGVGINDSGTVVGYIGAGYSTQSFSGTTSNTLSHTGSGSYVGAINNSGQIAGTVYNNGTGEATRWADDISTGAPLAELGPTYSEGLDINASGTIAGHYEANGGSVQRGFRATSNGDVVTLDGLDSNQGARANAINDNNVTVGWAQTAGGDTHAILWEANGDLVDLGALSGERWSYAQDVNNYGQAIGYVDGLSGIYAFLFSGGMFYDLNTLLDPGATGWTIERANAINDLGQILVDALDINGNRHVLLLTPDQLNGVPMPMPLALLGAGLALIGFRRYD
ncbi:MAG: hypothetical protein H6981_15385 [Gammaproteobacteria bacterium]|nr:hypothetical protein [Gammaproteobacteria bacterium]MCP5138169.1 hypothetical protein [Gammaproteobacteria bacterium]